MLGTYMKQLSSVIAYIITAINSWSITNLLFFLSLDVYKAKKKNPA